MVLLVVSSADPVLDRLDETDPPVHGATALSPTFVYDCERDSPPFGEASYLVRSGRSITHEQPLPNRYVALFNRFGRRVSET